MRSIGGTYIFDYIIAVDKNANADILNAAEYLRRKEVEVNGYNLRIIPDLDVNVPLKIKIFVDGSLADNEARIYVDGKTLNITGGHYITVCSAVRYFADSIDEKTNIAKDYDFTGTFNSVPLTCEKYSDMKLVWNDEFDYKYDQFDRAKWNLQAMPTGLSGDVYQTGTKKNIFIEDEQLYLRACREDEATFGRPYSIAYHMSTQFTMNWTYGYLEMRAKIPTGRGFWPSLFTLQRDDLRTDVAWSSEIDIFESFAHKGGLLPDLHIWHNNGIHNSGAKPSVRKSCKGLDDGFHTFGFYWDEKTMIMSVDGNEYCTLDIFESTFDRPEGIVCPIGDQGMGVFRTPVYMMIGSPLFTPKAGFKPENSVIDDSVPMPADYVIDYIRLYQGENGELILNS